jgi:hypothetical protein
MDYDDRGAIVGYSSASGWCSSTGRHAARYGSTACTPSPRTQLSAIARGRGLRPLLPGVAWPAPGITGT